MSNLFCGQREGANDVQRFSDCGEEAARTAPEAHAEGRGQPGRGCPRDVLGREAAGPVDPRPEELHAEAEADLLMSSFSIWHWIVVLLVPFGIYWFFRSLIRAWHREGRKGDG